jgi:hypothetical protein
VEGALARSSEPLLSGCVPPRTNLKGLSLSPGADARHSQVFSIPSAQRRWIVSAEEQPANPNRFFHIPSHSSTFATLQSPAQAAVAKPDNQAQKKRIGSLIFAIS